MCDFLSIIVRHDGKIGHIPSNSHSETVKALGWRENDDLHRDEKRFVEVEWNCEGEFPGADKISRGEINESEINEKQRKAIECFYGNAAKLLAEPEKHAERMLFGRGYFSDDRFADMRWRVLIHPKCPHHVADKLAVLALHTNGERVKSLHPKITNLAGNLAVEDGYEVNAPALAEIGGNLDVSGSAKFDALTKIGGNLDVYGSAKFDALTKIGGNLDVSGSAKFDALTKIGGNLDVSGSAKFDALVKIGGNLDVYGSAKFDAPVLKR